MRSLIVLFLSIFVLSLQSCGGDGGNAKTATTTSTHAETTTPASITANNTPASTGSLPYDPNRTLESPDIKLKIDNIKRNQKAYLIGQYGTQRYRADSSLVAADGSMRFSRKEPYEPGLYVVFLPRELSFQILIDADQTMTITGDVENIDQSNVVKGNIDTELLQETNRYEIGVRQKLANLSRQMQGTAQGSAERARLQEQREQIIAERKAYLQNLFEEYPNSLFTSFKRGGQNPEVKDIRKPDGTIDTLAQFNQYRADFWNSINFDDPRLLRTPLIANMLERYFTQLTNKNASSIITSTDEVLSKVVDNPNRKEYFQVISNWIAMQNQPGKATYMDAEAVYVHLVQNYFTRERAVWADSMEIYALQKRASEMAASRVGQPAPNVISTDPNGRKKELLAIEAPYIVVYMYNPDCEHCQEQTPKLVEFYRQWKPRGVEVFGIAIDTNQERWKEYIQQTGMSWINVFDPTNRSIYAKYYVDITPEIYVINPDRKIIGKNLQVHQIQEIIRRDQQSS